ncbi:hypothetical protein L207DRAFT_121337 [Hyaloscypha variabilis F]|uniref:Uncharacterized protein n=1 Tax=Hyaloscypha variabilis (strain UAMH 11265 / GT02V1 / F) TaxID=1149755 RepID=A0A2J6RB61_HYAVF|nr:hypothetical protein L207DRAFT_121337 [Hyaloscypha variabilis F]
MACIRSTCHIHVFRREFIFLMQIQCPLSSAEVRPSPAKSSLSMSETPMSSAFPKPADATTSQDFPDQVLPHHAQQPVLGELELAIPFRHSTAPQNILSWPCMQEFSLQEDVRYPMRVELARSQDALSSLYNTSNGTYHNIKDMHAGWTSFLYLISSRLLAITLRVPIPTPQF